MRIKDKLEGLRATLKPLTKEQKEEAKRTHAKYFSTSYKTKIFCLETGKEYKGNTEEAKRKGKFTCPKTGNLLNYATWYNQGGYVSKNYFGVVDRAGDYQVIRLFFSEKHMKKGEKATYTLKEVINHFVGIDGKMYTLLHKKQMMTYNLDAWVRSESDLKLRNSKWTENYQRFYPRGYSKAKRIHPFFKRNGFKGGFHGVCPNQLLMELATNSKIETLWKAKFYNLVDKHISGAVNINKYWDSLRIVIRNDYRPKDMGLWFDYIDLIKEQGKDIKNAHYVCPENLKEVHDIAVKKAEIGKNLIGANLQYIKDKAEYFDLAFVKGGLRVEPLKSVHDFCVNGKALNHCVFKNKYYQKKENLILQATVDGEIVETININLRTMEIIEVRGYDNDPSKYNSKVYDLVRQNLKKVQEIALKQAS